MKRKYVKPNMMVIILANRIQLLANSDDRIQGRGNYNMRYGGVDDDGLDPE